MELRKSVVIMTTTATTLIQMGTSEMTTPSEQERTAVAQTSPRTPSVVEPDTVPGEEINIEKDAEASEKSKEAEVQTKGSGTKLEKTEQYNKYELTGSGEMPEQKVNKGIKDINYHNMVVVIAVGDKVINNVGGIRTVAEKWGLSFSVVERALSGIKEHRQSGHQYDKLAGRPQRRSRRKERENHKKRTNQIKKLHHLPKSQRPERGSDQRRLQKRRFKKNLRVMMMMMMMILPNIPL